MMLWREGCSGVGPKYFPHTPHTKRVWGFLHLRQLMRTKLSREKQRKVCCENIDGGGL
jgi:hypothetical protein